MTDIKLITITTKKVVKLATSALNYQLKQWETEFNALDENLMYRAKKTQYGIDLLKRINLILHGIEVLNSIWPNMANTDKFDITS